MPHGETWLSYIPGYDALAGWIDGFGPSWYFQHPVHVQHIAGLLLVILVLFLFSLVARRGLKNGDDILPEDRLTPRNLMELLMEGILGVMEFAMSREAALRHFWLVGPLALFILFSNLLGLIPGFLPPTENFNTTFACATVVFVYYNAYAIYKLGWGHLAHMANPSGDAAGWVLSPLMLIIELISHIVRPISLAVRLLCNMAGDHLVLAVFVGIFPFLLPIPFQVLGLFVALVQTFIFTLLSSVYIAEVEHNIAEHEAHHGEGDAAAAH